MYQPLTTNTNIKELTSGREVEIIDQKSEHYPYVFERLTRTERPVTLYCQGNLALLNANIVRVAITGAQAYSPKGKLVAEKVAALFASQNYTIVSGNAGGIDSFAELAVLALNKPMIAVLPHGLQITHEYRNRELAARILGNGGLLISEYPAGPPSYERYYARNRIIVALSSVLIPVQGMTNERTDERGRTIRSGGTYQGACKAREYLIPIWVPLPPLIEEDARASGDKWALNRFLIQEGYPAFHRNLFNGSPQQNYSEMLAILKEEQEQ